MTTLQVLLVDDSSTMRSILRNVLQLSGLNIGRFIEASNGMEGLHKLETEHVDVLLVDLNMPVMRGEELIKQIRSRPEFDALPILVVSSEIDQVGIQEDPARKLRVLHKPFIPEQIHNLVVSMRTSASAAK